MALAPVPRRLAPPRLHLWLAMLVCLLPLSANAEDYDVGGAVFEVPDGWTVTYSSRDREYDFTSPDGRFQLWARWWLPDEPLLGFDDIVAHDTRPVAGQQALFIHSETGADRLLQLAFPRLNEDGDQFLWQLWATDVPLAEHQALFDVLLRGLSLEGVPALGGGAAPPAPTGIPLIPTVPQPAPSAPKGGQGAPPVPGPDVSVPPAGGETRFNDPGGAFSLPQPAGWASYSAEAAGLRQGMLVSPGQDALVLAAVAMPDGARSAVEVMEGYLDLLLSDVIQPRSIEDEDFPAIAGAEAHGVEYTARIYAINSIALPYRHGRVWVYRAPDAAPPFALITVRGEDAAPGLADALTGIAHGFSLGAGAAAPVAAPETVPVTAPDSTPPDVAIGVGPQDAPRPAGLLFDGRSLSGLEPFGFQGGDFAQDARLGPAGLAIAIAKGRGWAKVGIAAIGAPVPLPQAGEIRRIRAEIDGGRSNGITLALAPPGAALEDPHEAHLLRLQIVHEGEGAGLLKMSMLSGAESDSTTFHWPAGQAGQVAFDVLIRPDQVIQLHDGTGVELARMTYRTPLPEGPVVVQAYVQPADKNGPADLVLNRLGTDLLPFAPAPGIGALIETPLADDMLFNGMGLGGLWAPNAQRKADYGRFARMADGALRVRWAAGDGGSYVGIVAPEPVLWLDGLRGMGEARLTFEIDPDETGDFEISFGGPYTLPGNLSSNGSYVLRVTRQPDGSYSALSFLRGYDRHGLKIEGLDRLPERITLVLRPGRVSVEAEGIDLAPLTSTLLDAGAGLRISVHALADADGAGALALRRISRSVIPGRAVPPPVPAPGVDPLPETALFTPPMGPGWEGVSAHGSEFAELAKPVPGGITLRREVPVPNRYRIALAGPDQAVLLDERLDRTPYELTLRVDPAADLGVRLFLSPGPDNFEARAVMVLGLRVLDHGPEAGGLEIRLHTDHFSYDHWRRVLPAGWWTANWDGRVGLRFGDGWIAVMMDGQPVMRGLSGRSVRGLTLYPALVPGGIHWTEGGNVTLRGLAGRWVTPDAMSAALRWNLVDQGTFDPDAFADLLATDLMETEQ